MSRLLNKYTKYFVKVVMRRLSMPERACTTAAAGLHSNPWVNAGCCHHSLNSWVPSEHSRSIHQASRLPRAGLQRHNTHSQQQQYWYDEQRPQQLQAALSLPSWRFQTLIHKEPSILDYHPETLQLTIQALCEALHAHPKTVVSIIEQRPCLLRQPQEAVQVLQQLSQLLGRTPQQTAFLLSPHSQLLAMPPAQLQQHIAQVCEVMHWPLSELRSVTSAAATGPASFLQLLAMPVQQISARLQDLSTGLATSSYIAAQLAQHHPALLNMSTAVLRSRLFAVAQAEGSSCGQLLQQLDQQQLKGLSGLLLMSPSRLMQHMEGLQALLLSLQQAALQRQPGVQQAIVGHVADASCSGSSSKDGGSQDSPSSSSSSSTTSSSSVPPDISQLAARLLLRLGTRVTLAQVQVKVVMLQGITRKVQQWHQQLAHAGDADLAVLLSASTEGIAQAKYLAECRGEEAGAEPLLRVVLMPAGKFSSRWQGDADWLGGGTA
jgi:hypothetical protein